MLKASGEPKARGQTCQDDCRGDGKGGAGQDRDIEQQTTSCRAECLSEARRGGHPAEVGPLRLTSTQRHPIRDDRRQNAGTRGNQGHGDDHGDVGVREWNREQAERQDRQAQA